MQEEESPVSLPTLLSEVDKPLQLALKDSPFIVLYTLVTRLTTHVYTGKKLKTHTLRNDFQKSCLLFRHYSLCFGVPKITLSMPTYGNMLLSPVHHQLLQEVNKETGFTHLQDEWQRLGSVKTTSKLSTFIQKVREKGPTNRSIHYPGHGEVMPGAHLDNT